MIRNRQSLMLLIPVILMVCYLGCGKADKQKVEKPQEQVNQIQNEEPDISRNQVRQPQAEEPQKQATQPQEETVEPELIEYKITRRWPLGMEVSVPHFASEEEIKRLNEELVNTHFRGVRQVHIQYHCLDHPVLNPHISAAKTTSKYFMEKEMIATYSRPGEGFLMWNPLPGDRYPDIMTIQEIKNLDATTRK
jgi:hypothetical protein